MSERIEELERRLSAMEEYLGIEWYDVPGRERYVKKEVKNENALVLR